jgi:hypothetical protein
MIPYLEPTDTQGRALFLRGIEGPVVMLNLLRFRDVADYANAPDLASEAPISGRAAFDLYIAHARPFLEDAGGEVLFMCDGGPLFIGPDEERWDLAMLIRQPSVAAFFAYAANDAYMAGIGHRIAALEDSRLLPLAGRIG